MVMQEKESVRKVNTTVVVLKRLDLDINQTLFECSLLMFKVVQYVCM